MGAALPTSAELMHALLPPLHAAPQRTLAITYGTYDLFHVGHVRLFARIKQRWDRLVVAVSTDEFNATKGKKSAVPFADRIEIVRACRHVDLAIPEHGWEQKERDIVAYGADAFVMGDDWTGRFDQLRALCEVVYLPRTTGISSTDLKTAIRG
ncbi:MAG: adenylyltransferase/cytidyltransferase family protein [Aquabacterium sp.]